MKCIEENDFVFPLSSNRVMVIYDIRVMSVGAKKVQAGHQSVNTLRRIKCVSHPEVMGTSASVCRGGSDPGVC